MLQWKKLQYYAKQNGIENQQKVRLTDDDCEYICKAVGVPVVTSFEIDGKFDPLISYVMDDPGFREAHRNAGVSEEVFLIRCGDYASVEVFRAYASKHGLSPVSAE